MYSSVFPSRTALNTRNIIQSVYIYPETPFCIRAGAALITASSLPRSVRRVVRLEFSRFADNVSGDRRYYIHPCLSLTTSSRVLPPSAVVFTIQCWPGGASRRRRLTSLYHFHLVPFFFILIPDVSPSRFYYRRKTVLFVNVVSGP